MSTIGMSGPPRETGDRGPTYGRCLHRGSWQRTVGMKFGTCGHRIREDDIRRLWGERYLASGWESLGAAWKWKAIQRAFCPPRAGARWHYRQRLGSPRIGSAPTVTLRGLTFDQPCASTPGRMAFFSIASDRDRLRIGKPWILLENPIHVRHVAASRESDGMGLQIERTECWYGGRVLF